MTLSGRTSCRRIPAMFLAAVIAVLPLTALAEDGNRPNRNLAANGTAVLWQAPADIASRNLFYGPGGKEHAPHTTFTFIKEDTSGSTPKFEIRDENGVEWKVKLGVEARPETVASRLLWAVGYFSDEDYYLPVLHVENMQHLRRGENLVSSDGSMHDVRLERHLNDEKKVSDWKWRDNPFEREREFNGLRVLMAVMNNWDLKNTNNSIYEVKGTNDASPALRYVVADLGASFGTTGESWSHGRSKGNLESYQHSKFISKVTPEYVDFAAPSHPALIYIFTPKEFITRMDMRWIGRRIPRTDAKWMGSLLAQLSPDQIRDAFRAAGYSPAQVDGFSAVVEQRIAQLNKL